MKEYFLISLNTNIMQMLVSKTLKPIKGYLGKVTIDQEGGYYHGEAYWVENEGFKSPSKDSAIEGIVEAEIEVEFSNFECRVNVINSKKPEQRETIDLSKQYCSKLYNYIKLEQNNPELAEQYREESHVYHANKNQENNPSYH